MSVWGKKKGKENRRKNKRRKHHVKKGRIVEEKQNYRINKKKENYPLMPLNYRLGHRVTIALKGFI